MTVRCFLALLGVLTACAPAATVVANEGQPTVGGATHRAADAQRQYGAPVELGEGSARTYVVFDTKDGKTPLEFGIALDARALEGLPVSGTHIMDLPLPERVPLPYRFVMLDWSAQGHHPDGVYNRPHFDFHFYLTLAEEVAAITPEDPSFAMKANRVPTGDYVP